MRRFLFLILILAFSVLVSAQYDSKLAEIDNYIQQTQADWNVPGIAVAIVKDGKTIFAKGYGVRELGKPEKVDENTLFAIASNSKAFTTAALAILIDEGKISGWDEKVSTYLPEFQLFDPYATRELTIRDLVCHRSGLDTFSGDLLWYETTYTPDEILRRVRYLKPVSSFRSKYGYQNLMYIAAGRIIEKVSGKSWGEFIKERILLPLGINRTTTTVRDIKENYASPHNESGGGKLRPLPLGNIDNAIGAAGLNSSVADMTKWLLLQLGRGKFGEKRIYSEQRAGEMWSPCMIIGVNPFPPKEAPTQIFSGYGLGWFISDYRGKKLISHSGGLDGMISQTAIMPAEDLALVVLTNSETRASLAIRNKILDVFLNAPARDWSKEYLKQAMQQRERKAEEDKKADASRIPNTKPTLPLEKYAGIYSSQMYGDVQITQENGKLVMRFLPAPNFVADLEHWHYDTFLIKWRSSVNYNFPRGWVTFVIDKNGTPDELKIDQPNDDFWFYELELKRKK
ncbi:MAG: serine hydrolase [Acidobacteria bacterium]|jgi:CubicO group peptidase (beta-lactamase class C family)|nr:MAG: serine hydrolase [Acidobacteriota bacterium]GIU80991.1 MAG: serine hydrolase [Pyrinomonadaceae bacterium]